MNWWERFLASLDTPGGHIFLLFTMAGLALYAHIPEVDKYRGEIFGGLLLAMRAQQMRIP